MNKHTGPHTLRIVQNNLTVNESAEGETLEQQIERMISNKEPITNADALMYTERKDGVRPETNIRTDRFEIAIEATDKIQRSYSARREERQKLKEQENGGTESIPTPGNGDGGKTAA